MENEVRPDMDKQMTLIRKEVEALGKVVRTRELDEAYDRAESVEVLCHELRTLINAEQAKGR